MSLEFLEVRQLLAGSEQGKSEDPCAPHIICKCTPDGNFVTSLGEGVLEGVGSTYSGFKWVQATLKGVENSFRELSVLEKMSLITNLAVGGAAMGVEFYYVFKHQNDKLTLAKPLAATIVTQSLTTNVLQAILGIPFKSAIGESMIGTATGMVIISAIGFLTYYGKRVLGM